MSSLPSDLPKLPKWPFFLFDVILLATAAIVAWNNPGALHGVPLFAVIGCVILAAALCVVPLVADYMRSQDKALDERQRALDELTTKVSASSEQIGIAAQGLCEVAETTHRALKVAEHLPQKVQEKLSELQQRLDTSRDEEIEDLERELATLRSSEGDRLDSAADKVHEIAAELTKVEASAAKHLMAVTEALSKAEHIADKAAGRLTQAADESATRVSAALSRTMASAQDSTREALSAEQKRVLEAIGAKIDATLGALEAQSSRAAITLEAKIALLEAVVANLKAAVAEATRITTIPAQAAATEATGDVSGDLSADLSSVASPVEEKEAQIPAPAEEQPVAAPKRSRRAKRDHAAPVQAEPEPAETPATPVAESAAPAAKESEAVAASPETLTEKTDESAAPVPVVETLSAPAETKESAGPAHEEAPADDFSQEPQGEASASMAISADGATRLIVTAYIGIGNRLYIRGDGPGLSWEKGLPLQFVSIGKWRWESAEATVPVKLKLLKNDQTECPSIGELTLVPGHQAEVTANF